MCMCISLYIYIYIYIHSSWETTRNGKYDTQFSLAIGRLVSDRNQMRKEQVENLHDAFKHSLVTSGSQSFPIATCYTCCSHVTMFKMDYSHNLVSTLSRTSHGVCWQVVSAHHDVFRLHAVADSKFYCEGCYRPPVHRCHVKVVGFLLPFCENSQALCDQLSYLEALQST